jgi:hypothetical protein
MVPSNATLMSCSHVVQVTPHPQCVVRVTTMGTAVNSTAEGFYLNGIAVVLFTKSRPQSPIDKQACAVFKQTWPDWQNR